MNGFTAGEAVRRLEHAIGRPIDALIFNEGNPSDEVLARYAVEHKHPLALGDLPATCRVVSGHFWTGDIARHDRSRLAHVLWAVLATTMVRPAA